VTREEERGVIQRVLVGETECFEVLVRSNQRRVYNLCLRMTGNAEDAEDLAQESFIRAYQNLESFKGESGFGPWLYRLASNICIDHLRREKRREKGSLTYLDDSGAAQEIEVPDERFTPEVLFERRQAEEQVRQGLDNLTTEHRTILVLRELNGLCYDEIGSALGLSVGTVKSRISRARLALSKILLQEGNFFERHSSRRETSDGGVTGDGAL